MSMAEDESREHRDRLAWEARIAADRQNAGAVAWAERQAAYLVARLARREAEQD
ncbi:hypothetical protein VMT65_09900 [Nocardia sp. CDC153]|uniref:hypothetical protein n=1 Tax=Nocardia sp. CDC153 TaxID=3112167 RepID=UPI002DB7EFD3|nr:hypothetical protein [Nocardia sp. CDC153]MEC3953342.1 hypothetical protein [Nocardia sp. CDC153]